MHLHHTNADSFGKRNPEQWCRCVKLCNNVNTRRLPRPPRIIQGRRQICWLLDTYTEAVDVTPTCVKSVSRYAKISFLCYHFFHDASS